ncbi:MAG: hypothetical protein ACR2JK_08345 [Geodermatophilaceae bacterium]
MIMVWMIFVVLAAGSLRVGAAAASGALTGVSDVVRVGALSAFRPVAG